MEQVIAFLSSDTGRIVCFALLGAGVLDILIPRLTFGRNIKKLEQTISPAMSPEKRQPIEKQINGLQMVMRITTFGGLAFIAFAVFGLTR